MDHENHGKPWAAGTNWKIRNGAIGAVLSAGKVSSEFRPGRGWSGSEALRLKAPEPAAGSRQGRTGVDRLEHRWAAFDNISKGDITGHRCIFLFFHGFLKRLISSVDISCLWKKASFYPPLNQTKI
jgi:hypothetical protein